MLLCITGFLWKDPLRKFLFLFQYFYCPISKQWFVFFKWTLLNFTNNQESFIVLTVTKLRTKFITSLKKIEEIIYKLHLNEMDFEQNYMGFMASNLYIDTLFAFILFFLSLFSYHFTFVINLKCLYSIYDLLFLWNIWQIKERKNREEIDYIQVIIKKWTALILTKMPYPFGALLTSK